MPSSTSTPFPSSTPSEQGVDPTGLLAFVEALDADPGIEPHALIVHRHGRRVLEAAWAPHTTLRPRLVYSLSKTFTGTALGLQVGEGRLGLDDLVSDHLPELFDDDTPERTGRMRIRHIATMASGHDRETIAEAAALDPHDPVRGFLRIPPDAEPGSLFAYNQPPVLTLATVLQRRCGERLSEYLRTRLLEPIGIDAFRWRHTSAGVDLGFSGVFTNLDAIARLGQLYLDDGRWNGRRVLPEGWVAEASRVHTPNPLGEGIDWRQGYGIQLWRSQHGYRGDGAFGQYLVILPEQDLVVALFSCTEVMQRVMDLMWELLLPALHDAPVVGDDDALLARTSSLGQPTARRRLGGTPVEPSAVGMPMSFAPVPKGTPTHRSITSVEVDGDRLLLYEDGHSLVVPLSDRWTTSPDGAVSASATVRDDGRLAVDVVLVHTPHRIELTLDPATATFSAVWPLMPLFGVGVDRRLSSMLLPPN